MTGPTYGVAIYQKPNKEYGWFWAQTSPTTRGEKSFSETLTDLIVNGNKIIARTRSPDFLPEEPARQALTAARAMSDLANRGYIDSVKLAMRSLFKRPTPRKSKKR